MGDSISPDVDATLIDRCGTETLLSTYEDDSKHLEVHEPFEGASLKHGIPFIAIIDRAGDETTVREVGHFDYSGSHDGLPSLAVLISEYSPLPEDDTLTEDETEFVEALIQNQYNPSGPLPHEDTDWTGSTYTGRYLVSEIDPAEYRHTGELIYPNDDDYRDDTVDFGVDRRDELIEATVQMVSKFAVSIAGVPEDQTYVVREARIHDFHERAKNLYLNAPSITQTQAVTWALRELTLTQTHIATLRGKTQPTISNHLERAATHYVRSQKTADAFGSLPQYMDQSFLKEIQIEIAEEAAEERFRLEKTKTKVHAKCPECGLDAGGLDDDVTTFWVANKTLDGFQNPRDPRHVECPECGYDDNISTFESEWTEEHGAIPTGPDPL